MFAACVLQCVGKHREKSLQLWLELKEGGEHTKGTRECTHELEVCVLTHMYVYGMPVFLCNTSAISSNQSTLTTK